MSHVTTVPCKIRDLGCAESMCQRMGWELRKGQKKYAWYGRHVGDYPVPEGFKVEDLGKCDHAIRVPGISYEVGLVRREDEDGEYLVPIFDFVHSAIRKEMGGEKAPRLVQGYATELAKSKAARAGKVIEEVRLPDGTIRLVSTDKKWARQKPTVWKRTIEKAKRTIEKAKQLIGV